MMRVLRFSLIGLLIASAALYVGDWAAFTLRGSPTDQVTVSLFVSAPLKDNKQEIDFIGQEQWSCTRTMFPQVPFAHDRSMPCWYLRRHTNQVTTY